MKKGKISGECVTTSKKSRMNKPLLAWAKEHYRQYPWRENCGKPYSILAAEILLKRTTATAVARIYNEFMTRYPNIQELSEETEEDLSRVLQPIGLYRQRAGDIKKLTDHLVVYEQGMIPDSLAKLLGVPGIGGYSARAILSFGYGVPVAVVDGNVSRIIKRLYQGSTPQINTIAQVQELVDLLLPKRKHRDFNFAMLDLGSLVCRPKPKCQECPVRGYCDYSQTQKR